MSALRKSNSQFNAALLQALSTCMMPSEGIPNHLPASELGTRKYWDSLYTNEITNHTSNPEDTGTVWFDDSDAEAKVLSFLASRDTLPRHHTSFLDLGCGNGSMLFSLRDYGHENGADGWKGRMLGVDYSNHSISLAKQISSERDRGDGDNIEFRTWDILNGAWSVVLEGLQGQGWDIVLDKGTFDAISLSSDTDEHGRRLCEGYRDRIIQLVRRGGLFIITSCNWTKAELEKWIEGGEGIDGRFVFEEQVDYPSYTFGGHRGQTITTLCFRKL